MIRRWYARLQSPSEMRRYRALLCLGCLCCSASRGDDIEIFLGPAERLALRPDIMFVIDTRASMGEPMPDGATRLSTAGRLVLDLLDTLEPARVGLVYGTGPGDITVLPLREPDAIPPVPEGAVGSVDPGNCDQQQTDPCTVRSQLSAQLGQLRAGGTVDLAALASAAARELLAPDPGVGPGPGESPAGDDCAPADRLILMTDRQMGASDAVAPAVPAASFVTQLVDLGRGSLTLQDIVAAAGGAYHGLGGLADARSAEIADSLPSSAAFTGPLPVVSQFTRLGHGSDLYFGVFQPDVFPRWRGNLKRYALARRGEIVVDSDGRAAIDENTGAFAPRARSIWSQVPDGADVARGGAAARLPAHDRRRVYTLLPGARSDRLAAPENALHPGNSRLDPAILDADTLSPEALAGHVEWIRGRDVDDEDGDGDTRENRHAFGDPLHSRPVAVHYGAADADADVEVFIGTNAGALHAISGRTGVETFAFVPAETLPMQQILRRNRPTRPHPYGLDGSPMIWASDHGGNGIDPADPRDHVRLYMGMRRGGRHYYALDVTDRGDPRLLWQIRGGSRGSLGDFRELGQTWSRPTRVRLRIGGETLPRDALLFSAGYDPAQDDARTRTRDGQGRGMYLVDALSGELLWSGGRPQAQAWTREFAGMDYAFPGAPAAVDADNDGLADLWFAADTGGQLWRFDIHHDAPAARLVSGGIIGRLGAGEGRDEVGDNRRFFASPSVAIAGGVNGPELAVAIGSGFRPSPLSVLAQNRIYLVRQRAVFAAPGEYRAVTAADLRDASGAGADAATAVPAAGGREAAPGWYVDLPHPGEKALSSPLIVNDRVVFTTYTPGTAGNTCRPPPGVARTYSMRLSDGAHTQPQVLLAPSLVDEPVLVVAPAVTPADTPSPGAGAGDGSPSSGDVDDVGDDASAGRCPDGALISIRLNTEARPVDAWCSTPRATYWVRDQ